MIGQAGIIGPRFAVGRPDTNDSVILMEYNSTLGGFTIGSDYFSSGSYLPLSLRTSGADRLTILSGGNVGIGTTSPLSKLAVSGGASVGADYNIAAPTNGMIIQGNVGIGDTTPSALLEVSGSTAGDYITRITNTSASGYGLRIDTTTNTTAGEFALATYTGSGTGFFVTSDGNVGIGTTSPAGGDLTTPLLAP